uniref:Uncharacterized protein n=1 Tax=Chrysotila carterae TaxID=13221 RepID=A0A7S4C382_CHRCT
MLAHLLNGALQVARLRRDGEIVSCTQSRGVKGSTLKSQKAVGQTVAPPTHERLSQIQCTVLQASHARLPSHHRLQRSARARFSCVETRTLLLDAKAAQSP